MRIDVDAQGAPQAESASDEAVLHSYILLRADIPMAAQMAQLAHAAQEAAFMLGGQPPEPIHIVVLAAPDEAALARAAERLAAKGFDPRLFYEPHWPRGHTALYLKPARRGSKLRAAMGAYPLWEPQAAALTPRAVAEPTDDPLCPEIRIDPGSEDLARVAHLLKKMSNDLCDGLYHLRSALEKGSVEKAMAELGAMERWTELLSDSDSIDEWSKLCDRPESGYADFRGWLAEAHCGDCTAVPASCMRCHAESLLDLSTRPATKSIGSRMLGEKMKARKEAEEAELGTSPAPA